MTQPIIQLNNIHYRYNESSDDALQNVSINIEQGQIVGLLGPNGSGKTTLIKLIAGLLQPTQGKTSVFGKDPFSDATMRYQVGVMHQMPGFEQMLAGWENLYIVGRFFGLSIHEVQDKVRQYSNTLGPFPYFNQSVMTLSGGERRRLQFIRAILGSPSLLLLDEPTVGIDVHGRHQFYQSLQDIITENSMTVVWTTHYLEEVEHNCDHIIILMDGNVKIDSPISSVQKGFTQAEFQITVLPNSMLNLPENILSDLQLKQVSDSILSCTVSEQRVYTYLLPEICKYGVIIESVTKQIPTFEDVYLHLTTTVS
jgi:ABC-2 type transport system ATP-binding protein